MNNEDAFNTAYLNKCLREGELMVSFTKANGEKRTMRCTLKEDLIPQTKTANSDEKTTRAANPDVQRVWDLEKEDWRSFRYDSITEIYSL